MYKKALLGLLFLANILFADPTLEWGNMIGDNIYAAAGYRHEGGMPFDFTVILKIVGDDIITIDSASVTLAIDGGAGFSLPQGEQATKNTGRIRRGSKRYVYWHVTPPSGQEITLPNALRITGTYSVGATSKNFVAITRDITVARVMQTSQYQVVNNVFGDPLAGGFIEVYQSVTSAGGNPNHFTWSLFLSRYDVLDLKFVQSSFPNAPNEPHTYLPNTSGLSDGDYEILYRFNITQGGVPLVLNNTFYGLTGQWRGIDSELAGATLDSFNVQTQGFTGNVIDCATGQGVANIPISVYNSDGSPYDMRPRTFSDGSFSFGLKDPGMYILHFNDPVRSGYRSNYTSLRDDNNGYNYNLGANATLTVNQCLSYVPTDIAPLHSLAIVPTTALLDVGNSATFQVLGYDSVGHQLPPDSLGTLTWTSTKGLGSFTGYLSNAAFYRANTAGTDTISVTSSINSVSTTAGPILILPAPPTGSLHSISIIPSTATLPIGNTVLFEAVGYDVSGNQLPVDSLGTLTWGGGSMIGSYTSQQNNAAFFLPTTKGIDTLTVASSVGGITGRTGTITVLGTGGTTGPLSRIAIIPAATITEAGKTVIFQVVGYDSASNTLHPDSLGTLTWSGGSSVGSFTNQTDPAVFFLASTVGQDSVRVTSSVGSFQAAAAITVTPGTTYPGQLHSMAIIPNSDSLSTGQTVSFSVTGYDSAGAILPPDSLGTVTWSGGSSIGTLASATGIQVQFTGTTPGSGTLTATSSRNGVSATSGTITVLAVIGPPVVLNIDIDSGTVALDSVITIRVTAQDSAGLTVLLDDIEPYLTWSGGTQIGFYIDAAGATAVFQVTMLGTDSLTVTYADGDTTITATTGPLVAVPGIIGDIIIANASGTEVTTLNLTTDSDGQELYAYGFTPLGTPVGRIDVSWSVIDNPGLASAAPSSGSSTALTITGTGTFRVTASHTGGAADTTGLITVTGGKASTITVVLPSGTVSADNTLAVYVTATDADGNATNDVGLLTWSVTGDITGGSFNPNGSASDSTVFTPFQAGDGKLIVVSSYGITDTSDLMTVTPGDTSYVKISPTGKPFNVYLDETHVFYCLGYDAKGNFIDTMTAVWDTIGSLQGTFSSLGSGARSFTFTSPAAGASSGKITAGVSGLADTLSVTVFPYAIKIVKICWDALGTTPVKGTIPATTTDLDSVPMYAVGFDQTGTVTLGPVSVDWSLIGTAGGYITPLTGSVTRAIWTAPGTARLVASYQDGKAVDTTGAITINPGNVKTLSISPGAATMETTDTLTFTVTGKDADGNATTTLGTVTWASSGGLGVFSPATGAQVLYIALSVAGTDTITATSSLGVSASAGPIVIRRKVEPPKSWLLTVDNTFPDYNQTVTCTLRAIDRFGNTVPDTFACRYRINLTTQTGSEGVFTQPSGTVSLGGSAVSSDANGDYIAVGEMFNDGRLTFTVEYDAAGESLFVTAAQETSLATGTSPGIIWQPQQLLSKVLVYPSPVNFNTRSTMSIQYVLKYDAKVTLLILSATGALVYKDTYISSNGAMQGLNNVTWDGTTRKGNKAASGAYVMRFLVEANEGTMTLTRRIGIIGRK